MANNRNGSVKGRQKTPICPVCRQRLSSFNVKMLSVCPYCRYLIRGRIRYI